MSKRLPPVFYCDMCEFHIKVRGLRNGVPGQVPQFVAKRCTLCVTAEAEARTGSDREMAALP